MPTYEYKREDGTTFEVIQKMSDDPLTTCPDTGQKVKRIISGGGGVVYKGDGWYVTDYKDNGRKPASSSSSGTSEKGTNSTPSPTAEKTETPS
ncbi:FmdB family zinc ribbon protein [Gracilimonas tropica]|uniref:FmdB family zinc ribbon protein n=1 Tax=Gracilimonas tropica TaxID=454600 RepID=UPI000374ADB7|nr:zinc ribbon domain-containing protein [Gracilimonas tropica]